MKQLSFFFKKGHVTVCLARYVVYAYVMYFSMHCSIRTQNALQFIAPINIHNKFIDIVFITLTFDNTQNDIITWWQRRDSSYRTFK